ncbi:MAG: substrate-binding domain-containing protein [Ktedonobacteraceae bacterium]
MKLFSYKRLSALFGVILISILLAACGNSGTTGTSGGSTTPTKAGQGCKKVGVLLPETASSARWDSKDKPALTQGIATALGIDVSAVDYNNAGGDSATQQTQAQADLTKGDCILVVAAHDSAAAAAIVTQAKAKNVPVIAYDRLIQSKDLAYYVSFDNQKVGQLQGQYVANHYKDYTKDSNNLIMINGAQTDNNAILFHDGAHIALDPLISAGSLKKVYEQYTPDWNNDTARVEMDGALTANSSKVGVAYVANDGMANSVIASLKAKKLNGKVLVTGQDATVAGIHNILAGDQSMTVYKDISKEAKSTIDLIKAISAGTDTASLTNGATVKTSDGTAIPSILETPVAVDKANIASTVIADGFVTKSDVCPGIPAGTDGVC